MKPSLVLHDEVLEYSQAFKDGYTKGQQREREANKDQHDADMNELNWAYENGYNQAMRDVEAAGARLFGGDQSQSIRVRWLIESAKEHSPSE